MKNNLFYALILSLGTALAGFFISNGIVHFKKLDNKISVRGLAERVVDSDLATWKINIALGGNDLAEFNQNVEKNVAILEGFLQEQGFDKEEMQRLPIYINDKMKQDYTSNGKGLRYVGHASMVISSKKVTRVIEASQKTDQLLKRGVLPSHSQVQYYFTSLNDIKPDMLREATINAKEAAQSFAQTAGAKLGKIRSASQGLFSIGSVVSEYDSGDSFKKKVRVVTMLDFSAD